ncbi:MAG: hypothetical protein ACTS5P_01655 [Candidatus Hodgkinia cicadicola]
MGHAEVITSIDISLNFRRRLFTFAEVHSNSTSLPSIRPQSFYKALSLN